MVKHPVDQKKLVRLGVRPSEWLQLLAQYEGLLSAFRLADWSDDQARQKIAALLVQKTQQYLTSLELTLSNRSDEK